MNGFAVAISVDCKTVPVFELSRRQANVRGRGRENVRLRAFAGYSLDSSSAKKGSVLQSTISVSLELYTNTEKLLLQSFRKWVVLWLFSTTKECEKRFYIL